MSAFVIDIASYKKFHSILLYFYSSRGHKEFYVFEDILHPVFEFSKKYSGIKNPYATELITFFVQKLIELNYLSVNYRYNEVSDFSGDIKELDNYRPITIKGVLTGKDFSELANFLNCWNYQACEIPDDQLSAWQSQLLHTTIPQVLNLLYKTGLETACGRGSWGDMEVSCI